MSMVTFLRSLPSKVIYCVASLIGGCFILSSCTPFVKNVITYQNPGIDDYKIFANRHVVAGEGQPWRLAQDYNTAELDPELLKTIESFGPVAFLVLQNSEIVYEQYWDTHYEQAYSASFSMAKTIVSMLVGIALDEGKLKSLDQPVADFIPEFNQGQKADITFRHLLTMTSGLAWDETYTSPFSPTAELYYGEDLYQLVTTLSVKHEPGTVWYYSSADTQLLGIALEAAVGQTLSDYASEKLWKPLGAEQDASWSLDKVDGVTKANCCFNATARDFARLGQLVLNKGVWNHQQLVPQEYLLEASQPFPNLRDEQGKTVDYYGYQFWVGDFDGHPSPFFNGILGQYIFVVPHLNAIVVRLGQRDDPGYNDIAAYQHATLAILKDH
jgi:CubicO group peptidase (beta-lactamase class C family)